MSKVVQLKQFARSASRNWSPRELGEFYRVESILIQAGLRIDTESGISDEGDPWFAFCRADDGEVIVHIARIRGVYVLAGPSYDGIAYGSDISALVRDLVRRHPLVQMLGQNRGSNIFLHPAALLVAVVATAFFKSTEARALTDENHKANEIRGGGAAGRSDAVFIGEHQKTVIIDTAQRAVVLAAIAAVLADHQAAKADDAASMSSSDLLDSSVSLTPAAHGFTSLSTPVDVAVSQALDTHPAAGAFFTAPAHVAAVADALPLFTVLWDLAKTPQPTSKLDSSVVATASTNASIAIESLAMLITIGLPSPADGMLPAVQAVKIAHSDAHAGVETHALSQPDQLPSALIAALKDTTHGAVDVQQGDAANLNWHFDSYAGLHNEGAAGQFNLTSVLPLPFLDVSGMTAAQLANLSMTPGGTLNPGNIIVSDAVATTTSATTFANIRGFSTLGIGGAAADDGAGGIVDMANLPATINTILALTPAQLGAAITINDQVNALTVALWDNTTTANTLKVGAVGPAPGLADSLTVNIGNGWNANGDVIGAITAFGDELFTLTALGAATKTAGSLDSTGLVTLTPTLTGNEQVTIDGHADIFVGGSAVEPAGAIVDITGDVLQVNNLAITIINTRATALQGDVTAGTLLNFITDAGDNGGVFAPSIGYSTNAMTIDASASGGLIMLGGDANFVPGASVALSTGDTIIGAENPVGYQTGGAGSLVLGNVLVGSIGNDIIISKSLTLPDYIITEGGADKITLAAGHTGADHVGFYAAAGNVNVGGKYAVGSVTGAISEGGVALFEFANPGWWGIPAGGSSAKIETLLANGTGTSADNSTLTNFVPTQDFLDFSVKAWNTGTFVLGLIQDFGALANAAPGASGTGTAVHAVQVGPGGSIVGTAATPTNFIILSQGIFLDANAVASALHVGYNIIHSSLGATVEADFLVAYAGTDGNAHIADLHLAGGAGGTTTTFTDSHVYASDIVTLVGVSLNQLAANISHVHLVS